MERLTRPSPQALERSPFERDRRPYRKPSHRLSPLRWLRLCLRTSWRSPFRPCAPRPCAGGGAPLCGVAQRAPRRHAYTRARSTKLGRRRRAAPPISSTPGARQQPDMKRLHRSPNSPCRTAFRHSPPSMRPLLEDAPIGGPRYPDGFECPAEPLASCSSSRSAGDIGRARVALFPRLSDAVLARSVRRLSRHHDRGSFHRGHRGHAVAFVDGASEPSIWRAAGISQLWESNATSVSAGMNQPAASRSARRISDGSTPAS